MIKLAIKNGIHGIFNLTKVPKFEIETPTDNAKKIEKIKENNTRGCEFTNLKKPKTFKRINRKMQNPRIIVFSKAENSITTFLASIKVGLNKAAKTALCETDSRPKIVGS